MLGLTEVGTLKEDGCEVRKSLQAEARGLGNRQKPRLVHEAPKHDNTVTP